MPYENRNVHKLIEAWEGYKNFGEPGKIDENMLEFACKIDATARELREAKRQIAERLKGKEAT